mmetsp:Transcript_20165/g.31529  ORF Transcript_20165/g.31529 Transcript_20165/m.31529 type:complete len:226 (+) Transcript_20165:714-1391(+)
MMDKWHKDTSQKQNHQSIPCHTLKHGVRRLRIHQNEYPFIKQVRGQPTAGPNQRHLQGCRDDFCVRNGSSAGLNSGNSVSDPFWQPMGINLLEHPGPDFAPPDLVVLQPWNSAAIPSPLAMRGLPLPTIPSPARESVACFAKSRKIALVLVLTTMMAVSPNRFPSHRVSPPGPLAGLFLRRPQIRTRVIFPWDWLPNSTPSSANGNTPEGANEVVLLLMLLARWV